MESVWQIMEEEKADHTREIQKTENTCVDVIVIGAGMAGILTAYYLKQEGKSVLVLEGDKIASGQTRGTTAKITSQHDIKYSNLVKTMGHLAAWSYAHANQDAIEEYEKLISELKIDCGFQRCSAYLYSQTNTEELRAEAEAAKSLGIDAFFTTETELPFSVSGAVGFRNQARFSPLEFIKVLTRELDIEEDTKVYDIKGENVFTNRGIFRGTNIVVATHYPIINRVGYYFLRQHQERSYELALSGCGKMEGMYLGIDTDGLSFRQAGEFLLFGGMSHRTGKRGCGGVYQKLEMEAKKYFPECKIVTKWSAQDCMPHDGVPFIGRYSVFTPNLYVVTGFQKWGMTSSMVAAMILRDKICGRISPYEELFNPQRLHIKAGFKDWLTDVRESSIGLVKGLFHPSKRCTHMGCELQWNPNEHTWDCPCHGSRFDKDGDLLDNPANNRRN